MRSRFRKRCKRSGAAFNILAREPLLSKQVAGAKITLEDMIGRPGTAEVYVAVSYGAAKMPALTEVTNDKKARRINVYFRQSLMHPTSDATFQEGG